jgi:hypothetical protein
MKEAPKLRYKEEDYYTELWLREFESIYKDCVVNKVANNMTNLFGDYHFEIKIEVNPKEIIRNTIIPSGDIWGNDNSETIKKYGDRVFSINILYHTHTKTKKMKNDDYFNDIIEIIVREKSFEIILGWSEYKDIQKGYKLLIDGFNQKRIESGQTLIEDYKHYSLEDGYNLLLDIIKFIKETYKIKKQ